MATFDITAGPFVFYGPRLYEIPERSSGVEATDPNERFRRWTAHEEFARDFTRRRLGRPYHRQIWRRSVRLPDVNPKGRNHTLGKSIPSLITCRAN